MAYGFKAVRMYDGSAYNGALLNGTMAAEAVAVGKGDLLELNVSGTLERAEASDTQIAGVVQYFEWTDTSGVFHQANYISTTASLTVTVYYVPADGVVFSCQPDNITSAIAATDVGANFNIIVAADASSVTGLSKMELDSNTGATTSTLPLKLIGLVKKPGNDWDTTVQTVTNVATVEVEVLINSNLRNIGMTGMTT